MNTTILALEALVRYERHRARQARRLTAVRQAQRRGREFLLAHHLYRSHRTGNVIQRNYVRLAFPPQWHFDLLRDLDYSAMPAHLATLVSPTASTCSARSNVPTAGGH